MKKEFPILEFDNTGQSIINPSDTIKKRKDLPQHCVITFFYDIVEHFAEKGIIHEIMSLKSEMGKHPVYEFEINNSKVAIFHPGVGAPLAAALFEEVIELGCSKFIACGGAGVLDRSIVEGHLVIPYSAIRDEGTSYHYLPPSREVTPSINAVEKIKLVLDKHRIPYLNTKTWTTDGFYRETKGRTALRKDEGCLVVEMETAALFSVAKFRGVEIAQILYGGDNLDSEKWQYRNWQNNWSVREKLIWLAAEAALLI